MNEPKGTMTNKLTNQSLTNQGAVKVLALQGHMRMGEPTDRLRAEIEQNIHGGSSKLVLDMSAVKSLDSSGIGVLVRGLTLSKQHGGTVKLAALPEPVIHTLKITGLLKLFEVFPDAASAVASFS